MKNWHCRRAIGRVLCRMVWSKLHTFLLQGGTFSSTFCLGFFHLGCLLGWNFQVLPGFNPLELGGSFGFQNSGACSPHLQKTGDFHQYRFLLNLQRHSFEGVDIEPMDCFVPGFSTEIDPSTDPQGFVVERSGSWGKKTEFFEDLTHGLLLCGYSRLGNPGVL